MPSAPPTADPFAPTCPFCGKHDVAGLTYSFSMTEPAVLAVRHADRRECKGTPPSERRAPATTEPVTFRPLRPGEG